jgi:uncharacterized Tic20 family protein/DNA-binding XRE family transcriptional regulator
MNKTAPGARLAAQRRLKGWTQEELADKSGVTARTIQRVESGAVTPQAYTLKLLAESLDMDFGDLVQDLIPINITRAPAPAASAPTAAIAPPGRPKWLFLLHLLPLAMVILPGANILFPMVMWMMKKDEDEQYDIQGRKVLNFQFTMTIIVLLFIIVMVLFFPVGFPLFVVSVAYTIIMPVVNAIRVSSGKKIRYPLSIPFFNNVML